MTGPPPVGPPAWRPDPGARVRVTAPRGPSGPPIRRTAAGEIDAQSELGEVYLRSLLRTQLRLGLAVVAALALAVGSLPLAFVAAPWFFQHRVLGMPLAWVLLGAAVYPVLLGLGWWYVLAAERNERAFTDVVERP